MLAAVYVGDGSVRTMKAEAVAPGAGEVQIAVAYTGICGTDLHVLHGDMDARVRPPHVLGHEMSGTVATVGPEVAGWQVGDPVTVMPLRWCGRCAACRAGHEHICSHLDFVGLDSPGSLQPMWTVPAGLLVRLPADLGLREAALTEPLAVAVHDVGRADVQPGERVVVVGGGPVGFLIAVVAAARGAAVKIVELDAFRRGIAEEAGMDVIDPGVRPVADAVREWTEDAGADVVFEVSGSQVGVATALEVAGVRGRVVVVGIHAAAREVDLFGVFWRELTVLGARVYRRQDFETAVRLLSDGAVPVDALVSGVVALADAGDAFAQVAAGGSTMKVLIDCGAP